MPKISKVQQRDQEEIDCWLSETPYARTKRDKLLVPDLSLDDIVERYIPNDYSAYGAYFTPAEVAQQLGAYVTVGPDDHVIDPFAGIGTLLHEVDVYPDGCQYTAVELESRNFHVGSKLFPEWLWIQGNAFSVELPTNHFTWMVTNPPFNVKVGTYDMEERYGTKLCTKSHHYFLLLANDLLRPEGILLCVLPENFFETLPKRLSAWFDENFSVDLVINTEGVDWRFTGVKTSGFYIRKRQIRKMADGQRELPLFR